ncbi:MAG: hypothetical protein IK063_03665 [Clostridia bacterium]|nr:hypothetical protein [Clostridia bacterium]
MLCCVIAVLAVLSISCTCATSNVTYNGNARDFIFSPGSSYSPTDLFTNFKDVMPGAKITQTITVRNNPANNTDVRIYMRSLGAHNASYVDFLSKLKLTVTEVGASKLFEAPADQTDGLTEWHLLGTLLSGGEATLDVTLEVPTDLDNNYQKKIGIVDWEFMVEEFGESPDYSGTGVIVKDGPASPGAKDGHFESSRAPKEHINGPKGVFENVKEAIENLPFTGSTSHIAAFLVFLLSLVTCLIAIVFKKKRSDEDNREVRQTDEKE